MSDWHDGDELLQRWARWVHSDRYSLGYGRSMTDILISGLKGTVCWRCFGARYLHRGVECPTCKGHGRIFVPRRGINPALIPGTATARMDETAARVDSIVLSMPARRRRVVHEYYMGLGRIRDMAARLRCSVRTFERELNRARTETFSVLNAERERQEKYIESVASA